MITTLTDMTDLLEVTQVEVLEEMIQRMTINLPSVKSVPAPTKIETFQKTIKNMATTPDLTKINTEKNSENLQYIINNMIATNSEMIDLLGIKNGELLQEKLKNITATIPLLIKKFTSINWEIFKPTDTDVKKAQEILNSEDIERAIAKYFIEQKAEGDLNNVLKIVLLVLVLLYYTAVFISDSATITVKECTHNRVIPAVEAVINSNKKDSSQTPETALNQLNQELKKNMPIEMTGLFMIVTKDSLPVFHNHKKDSEIKGTLNFTNVVQFIERKNGWTRILYDSPREATVLEGWTLTEHLREIR